MFKLASKSQWLSCGCGEIAVLFGQAMCLTKSSAAAQQAALTSFVFHSIGYQFSSLYITHCMPIETRHRSAQTARGMLSRASLSGGSLASSRCNGGHSLQSAAHRMTAGGRHATLEFSAQRAARAALLPLRWFCCQSRSACSRILPQLPTQRHDHIAAHPQLARGPR
jgi:hypothetical protein